MPIDTSGDVPQPGCIDEVAQSIVNNIHDQQEGKPSAPEEKPDVPLVHKPDAETAKEAAAIPADGVLIVGKNGNGEGAEFASAGRAFPEILYDIVSDPTTDDMIGWLPHGKGFVIHDKVRFGKEILPKYFEGTKFTSFTRRLKRWSFTRIARGVELGAYYNENFVKDCPSRVLNMKYRVVHGDVVGAAAATMAMGGTTNAAVVAALAAQQAMFQGKKKAGKSKKGKRKADDIQDGYPGMMGNGEGFPGMQPYGPYGNMPPFNIMQQQYFHMMMAHQAAFQNMMANGNNNGNNQGSEDHNQDSNDANMTPQKQFQGNMPPFFPPYPMMGMPPNMMPPNMQNIPQQNYQGDQNGIQQYPNQMQSPAPQQQSPVVKNENADANRTF